MSTPEHVIIAGGGLAGAKTAEALREHGYRGELTLAWQIRSTLAQMTLKSH